MKINIEVDLDRADGIISFSATDVPLFDYRKIGQENIDEAICKAVEIAFLGRGEKKEQAQAMARLICYGDPSPRSACQADTTDNSDVERL